MKQFFAGSGNGYDHGTALIADEGYSFNSGYTFSYSVYAPSGVLAGYFPNMPNNHAAVACIEAQSGESLSGAILAGWKLIEVNDTTGETYSL